MRKRFVGLMIVIWAICLTISAANAADIKEGLVGYWPLDGDASDKAGDSDGVVYGDPTWVEGRKDQAIKLDGVDDYVNIPDFSLETNTITFVTWVKGQKSSDWTAILATRHPGIHNLGLAGDKLIEEDGTADQGFSEGIRYGNSEHLRYEWGDYNNGAPMWDGGPVIPRDEWALLAGVIEPDKATLYLYTDANGLESAERECNHPEETVTDLKIAFDPWEGPAHRCFKGLIDDARIYDRALSEEEIQAIVGYEPAAAEPAGKITTTWGTIKH